MKPATLVFLPGLGFKASLFDTVAAQFSPYPTLCCDLPALDLLAGKKLENVLHYLHAHLPHPAILIGWSLGGMVASALCARYPLHYPQCILIAHTPHFVATATWPGVKLDVATHFLEGAQKNEPQFIRHFHHLIQLPSEEDALLLSLQQHAWDRTQQADFIFYLNLLLQQDNRTPYHSLAVPTQQYFGERDAILPAAIRRHLSKFHATQVIKKAGHALFLSHSDLFCTQVLAFLSNSQREKIIPIS